MNRPDPDFLQMHSQLLCDSYERCTGLQLVTAGNPEQLAQLLYEAPFAVVSHGTEPDPLFNYANLQAQQLFAMPWQEIVGLPSRYSAEPMLREERAILLGRVTRYGYVDDYTGIRIAKDGRRFQINNATVWNLLDEQGRYCGQAALIIDYITL